MITSSAPSLDHVLPAPEAVEAAGARLREAGVRYVLSCWVDLLGIPKTKPVPIGEFEALCAGKGPQFAVHSISMVPDLGPADPDQVAIPDLDSLVICPWDRTFAWVFADLYFQGERYAGCPRGALKRQADSAAQANLQLLAGIEPEFTALRYVDGQPVKAFDNDPVAGFRPRRQAFGYDAEFSLDSMPFLDALAAAIEELGWGLTNVVAEGAYSQFELDFGHADALTTADRFTFLRVMIKEIAKQQGLFVSFMPKPMQGDWRNGAHINHSFAALGDGGGGNVYHQGEGWGEAAIDSLGGLMRHAGALTALTCSTVNSYKGLVARVAGFEGGTVTWAPTHISYGMNNRSTMFRLPQARWAIENRAADMTMNAYLALALTCAASLEGIQQQLSPGEPCNEAMYDRSDAEWSADGIQRLPKTLLEAVTAFDADPLAKAVLGDSMHEQFSAYKHDEWERFHQHVTEWETEEYLRFF